MDDYFHFTEHQEELQADDATQIPDSTKTTGQSSDAMQTDEHYSGKTQIKIGNPCYYI